MKRKRFISLLLALVISLPIFLSPLKVRASGESSKVENEDSLREKEREEREKDREQKREELKESGKKLSFEKEKQRDEKREEIKDLESKVKALLTNYEPSKVENIEIKDGSIEVGKEEGKAKTIQDAIDFAYNNPQIKTIKVSSKVSSDVYTENLTIVRKDGQGDLEIIGEDVSLNGSILISKQGSLDKSDGSSPKVRLSGFELNTSKEKKSNPNFAIYVKDIETDLEDLTIKNFEESICLIASAEKPSEANLSNLTIENNSKDFLIKNYNTKISNLNYLNNQAGILVEADNPMSLSVDKLKAEGNNVESGLIEASHIGKASFKGVKLVDNTIGGYNSLLDINNNDESKKTSKGIGDISLIDIETRNNKKLGEYKNGDLFNFENLSKLKIENLNGIDDYGGGLKTGSYEFELDDINFKNKLNDVDIFIEIPWGMDTENQIKAKINDYNIKTTGEDIRLHAFLSEINAKISNINIETENMSSLIFSFYEGVSNIEDVKIRATGSFSFTSDSLGIDYKNEYKDIDIECKLPDVHMDEMGFDAGLYYGDYRLKNIKLNNILPEEYKNYLGSLYINNSKVSLQDSDFKNVNSIEITDYKGSSSDYAIENLNIENQESEADIYNSKNFLYIYGGSEKDQSIDMKNIRLKGGTYSGLFNMNAMDQVNIYQLYASDFDIYNFFILDNVKNLNLINNSYTNISYNDYPASFNIMEDSSLNILNTIFDIEVMKIMSEGSKLNFKNSILPSKYNEVEGIETVELSIDDTNLIGKALLDEEGVPIKDNSQVKDRLVVVDKGNNDYIKGIDKDLANGERISGDKVDIGAFEYQHEITNPDPEPEKPGIPVEPEKPINPDPKPGEEGINEAYIEGFEDGTVRAKAGLTKVQAAVVFYRLIDDKIIEENYSEDTPFTDIRENYWGKKYIGTLVNLGIINGRPDGTFRPNEEIKRGELAKMIHVFEGIKKGEAKKFNDIEGHWAEEYIKSASEKGWLMGDDKGNFRPEDNISRIEFIITVNRVFDRNNKKENMIFKGINKFKDIKGNEWYYKDLVEATNSYKYKIKDGEKIWTELVK